MTIEKSEIEASIDMNVKIGNQQFVVVDYWWEDNDFVFITDVGEKHRCVNAYPVSMKLDGLEYSSSEDVTISMTTRYEKNKSS